MFLINSCKNEEREASICLSVPVISYLCFQKLSKKCARSFCPPPLFFLTALRLGKQSLDQLKNFFDDRWRSAPETKRRIIVSKINSSLFPFISWLNERGGQRGRFFLKKALFPTPGEGKMPSLKTPLLFFWPPPS